MRIRIVAIGFAATVCAAACNNTNKQADAKISNDSAQTSMSMQPMANDSAKMQEDWEKFKTDANDELRRDDDSLKAFKAKINKAGKKAETKYHEDVSRLEQRNEELKSKLQDYKARGKDDWQQFKVGFKSDLDTLGQKIKNLAGKIS